MPTMKNRDDMTNFAKGKVHGGSEDHMAFKYDSPETTPSWTPPEKGQSMIQKFRDMLSTDKEKRRKAKMHQEDKPRTWT